jgi:hypothetical protein
MRLVPGAVGVLLLLALLTWLLVRGIDNNVPAHLMTLKAFDDFALAQASLNRDVLQARAGLLRDYDGLAKAVETMENAVQRLRSHAQADGLDAGSAERLVAAVAQQEELTERFKSGNALLQNSLSYVGLLSTRPDFGAQDAPVLQTSSRSGSTGMQHRCPLSAPRQHRRYWRMPVYCTNSCLRSIKR